DREVVRTQIFVCNAAVVPDRSVSGRKADRCRIVLNCRGALAKLVPRKAALKVRIYISWITCDRVGVIRDRGRVVAKEVISLPSVEPDLRWPRVESQRS